MLVREHRSSLSLVSLEVIKAHLRLDHGQDDAYLSHLIETATDKMEKYLGRSLLEQTWMKTWHQDNTKGTPFLGGGKISIPLPYPPFLEILDITALVSEENQIIIRRFMIRGTTDRPCVVLSSPHQTFQIRYKTGYGWRPVHIPAPIRQALKMQVTHHYENRGLNPVPLYTDWQDLIQPYRVLGVS